ncbi:MAG: tRNA dihydrouridine synthase DusB [Elusimicrobia bacterium]|nr:tRNA dihydrouridine synthase DusB [Candidatus Obscuribacterium magneticum]
MIDPITRKLEYPVVQSPMAGCTDLAFRLVARRRGLEFAFLEMISANGLVYDSPETTELMKTVPEEGPLGVQLVGSDPGVMAEAAARMSEMGFSVLDLNLGCPVRKITAQGGGAALLKEPRRAEAIFKKVMKSVKKMPVTIKIRKGFDDPSGKQAIEIAQIAEACGIAAVTVHGRLRAQFYAGAADWDIVARVKKAVRIPVLGNGGIFSADDAWRFKEESGCDGVMVGRGGLGNPWIYSAIKAELLGGGKPPAPTAKDRLDAALEHLELEAKFEGERRAVLHMRRMGMWYLAGLPFAATWRDRLQKAETLEQVSDVLQSALVVPEDSVIPAKAGIQSGVHVLAPGFRRDDDSHGMTFPAG